MIYIVYLVYFLTSFVISSRTPCAAITYSQKSMDPSLGNPGIRYRKFPKINNHGYPRVYNREFKAILNNKFYLLCPNVDLVNKSVRKIAAIINI